VTVCGYKSSNAIGTDGMTGAIPKAERPHIPYPMCAFLHLDSQQLLSFVRDDVQAKVSSRLRTFWSCASTFATYVIVTNRGYFAKRPVRRPQNGRQVSSRMTKRCRTIATVYTVCLLAKIPGARGPSHLLVGPGGSYTLVQGWNRRSSQEAQFCLKLTHI